MPTRGASATPALASSASTMNVAKAQCWPTWGETAQHNRHRTHRTSPEAETPKAAAAAEPSDDQTIQTPLIRRGDGSLKEARLHLPPGPGGAGATPALETRSWDGSLEEARAAHCRLRCADRHPRWPSQPPGAAKAAHETAPALAPTPSSTDPAAAPSTWPQAPGPGPPAPGPRPPAPSPWPAAPTPGRRPQHPPSQHLFQHPRHTTATTPPPLLKRKKSVKSRITIPMMISIPMPMMKPTLITMMIRTRCVGSSKQ